MGYILTNSFVLVFNFLSVIFEFWLRGRIFHILKYFGAKCPALSCVCAYVHTCICIVERKQMQQNINNC